MAPLDALDFTGGIVKVISNEAELSLHIHKSLLSKNAPLLAIKKGRSHGVPVANVKVQFEELSIFAGWLYYRELLDIEDGECQREISIILEAHRLGKEVGCVEFMDTIFDELMRRITQLDYVHCLQEIVTYSLMHFQPNSGGWNFIVDYLVHFRELGDVSGVQVYEEIKETDNNDFLTDVARRILLVQGFQATENIRDPRFCKMLISGLTEARKWSDDAKESEYPWQADPCQYHRHTELGQECYKKKH